MSRLAVILLLMPMSITWAHAASLLPDVPDAKGPVSTTEKCVEPTEQMRRNHMEMLLTQRAKTMREGIRTKKHSLVRCINCHVKPLPDGTYPSHKDKKHFCAACHQYAGVTIDCFSCHRDKPKQMKKQTASVKKTNPVDANHPFDLTKKIVSKEAPQSPQQSNITQELK